MSINAVAAATGPDVSCNIWSRPRTNIASSHATSCGGGLRRMTRVAGAARRRADGDGPSLSLSLAAKGKRSVAWSRPRPLFPKSGEAAGARRAKTDGAHGGARDGGKGEGEGEVGGKVAPAAAEPPKLGAERSGSDAAKKGSGVGAGSGGKQHGNGGGGAGAGAASGGGGGGGGGVVGDLPHQVSELYAGMCKA